MIQNKAEDKILSHNLTRNEKYLSLLNNMDHKDVTVGEIAELGHQFMRKEKLHHHFFGGHSLFKNALHLALFSLKLPFEYDNETLLKKPINKNESLEIIKLFERRISERVPVEYLTEEALYLGKPFYVNKHVLVPRSLMNTRFRDFLNGIHWENNRVLDLCTGSGCIGITLALMNPKIKVDLADISLEALEVSKKNIQRYFLHDRVNCIQSDLFENIKEKYDLIITNPPYVTEKEYRACPDEFKNEPKIALTAGEQGLDIINKIIERARNHLNPNGTLIAEVGYTVAKRLKKKYRKVPFQWLNYRKSLQRESVLDTLIRWSGYLDSVFLCKAEGLPKFKV